MTAVIHTPFGDKHYINADYTASGSMHEPIENFMQTSVYPYYSNTHSNAHNGRLMAHYICQAKDKVRKSINAKSCDRIIFTGNGCTGAVVHLIHLLKLRVETKPRTAVFLSVAEHHSNYLPWTHLPVDLEIIPLKDGVVDLSYFRKRLRYRSSRGHPIVASIIAGSNVTGVIQPVYAISKLVHSFGGIAVFDFAASAPYVPIDMHCGEDPNCYFDAIYISPHKFLGGPGTPGILAAHSKLFRNEEPFCPGGGTVRFVCTEFKKYSDDMEKRETGGTPNILGSIKVGLVFQLKDKLLPYIIQREKAINNIVHPFLETVPGLHLINPPFAKDIRQFPVYSFTIDGLHYNFIVALLNDLYGVQSRGGVSCCSVYAQHLLHLDTNKRDRIYKQIVSGHGVPKDYGWCRVTFHYTMSDAIVNYILGAIQYIAGNGARYLDQYKYVEDTNNWIHRNYDLKFPPLEIA